MLSDLPSEIIVHIAIYLPTISDIVNLAKTCQRFYKIITAEESSIFRTFIQTRFPHIQTPPFWKGAARALASRSRALDRLGIIGRFVIPPDTATRIGFQEHTRRDNPTLGYRPAIDSYEVWNGECWADRREVLAWGAGHQIFLRSKQTGTRSKEQWVSFNDVEEPTSYDDICGLHLLKPEESKQDPGVENLIFARMRGDLVHLSLSLDAATHEIKRKFTTNGLLLEKTDLISDTLAAHFDNGSIGLYSLDNDSQEVEPFAWVGDGLDHTRRSRYSKLLSPSRLALATGQVKNSLSINTLSPDGVCVDREIGVESLDLEDQVGRTVHAAVTAIAPLNSHSYAGSPGDVFLATWGDRTIRLHDLRSPHAYESTYRDTTDINLIYSVHPFGHDRFLAGAGGNAVLKIFDLRMSNTYNYLGAQVPLTKTQSQPSTKLPTSTIPSYPRKDFSIFLSTQLPSIIPRNRRARNRRGPYRGPIYTMSSPSSSSPTVYTGIVDGVVRLDFASTDDLTGPASEWYDFNLGLEVEKGSPSVPVDAENVIRIAGYERPDPDDFTTTSKLRNQHGFWYPEPRYVNTGAGPGWDRRWEPLAQAGAWRRKGGSS
ncbi:uncharacterized protein N7483_011057 [Penicillium malachiteum]|uniref:uncharacterized protein n=1 Tax=Penicillium malachiteum TaxID=1324776 RepID=UPI002549B71B|nr:uncharacterized protein N7483_011057 [Penicillium malachiteum]KAJ5713876.1 hypothetical protein N7483_011057 [Penicillium malachiteum]